MWKKSCWLLVAGSLKQKLLSVVEKLDSVIIFVTDCITTISCGCVAHLYHINTDEQIHFSQRTRRKYTTQCSLLLCVRCVKLYLLNGERDDEACLDPDIHRAGATKFICVTIAGKIIVLLTKKEKEKRNKERQSDL